MSSRRPKSLHELADEIAKLIDEPESDLAHVTPGEFVIPVAMLTPEFVAIIGAEARRLGIDPARLFVGSGRNSINPRTGQPEFFDPSEEPIEEVTVTAPRETGLVQLPQDLPDEFRTYGTPLDGQGQYGVPAAMGVIGAASQAWTAAGHAPFNVGNLSKSDGSAFPPHTGRGHMDGTGIDIRPIRTDGRNLPISYGQPGYDREATQKLVDTLRATGGVQKIFFNDPQIRGVIADPDGIHDNHLHVRINPIWRRPPGA